MMTEQEMRAGIAENLGWKLSPPNQSWPDPFWVNPTDKSLRTVNELPNYPQDLNAMHEAEDAFGYSERKEWPMELRKIIMRDSEQPGLHIILDPDTDLVPDFYFYHATALQRAEAFCRVMFPERWKE
jgi:hypothetical protein